MFRDIRIAGRVLRSWRLGAAGAIATLAIGIGAATTMYAMLRVVLASSSADVPDAGRVARIYAASAGVDRSLPVLDDFERTLAPARSFEAIAAYRTSDATLGAGSATVNVTVAQVSESLFDVVRARPVEGRFFTSADAAADSPVALVGEAFWRRRFPEKSTNPQPTILLDGIERDVIGIVPTWVDFGLIGLAADVWIPLNSRNARTTVSVIARLGAESSWTAAGAELSLRAPSAGDGWRWRMIPIEQDNRYRTVSATTATLVPALIVLVIACLNVSCMLMARGLDRGAELTVRAALGASRGAIVRQLLTENLLLAAAGGMAGALLAVWGTRAVGAVFVLVKPELGERFTFGLDLLPVALGAAATACILFGIVPAIRLSRRDVAAELKDARVVVRPRVAGYGARDLVVFFEVGIAVVLVVATAMWFTFFHTLQQTTASFAAEEIVVHRVERSDRSAAAKRVRALASVAAVTESTGLPGRSRVSALLRAVNGRTSRGSVIGVGESFFETLSLPLVAGRGFDRTEKGKGAAVAVITESVARQLWPEVSALGRDLFVNGSGTRLTVVGISRNPIEFGGLGVLTAGDVYRPMDDGAADHTYLLIRSANARGALPEITAALRPRAGGAPAPSVFGDHLSFLPPEGSSVLRVVFAFALAALLLAATGIYGVISQSVAQRTTEFGIRLALGATRGQVLRMVLTRETKLIGAAIGAGAIGTVAVTRTLFGELVAITAAYPTRPALLIALCGVVAATGCVVATYRITRLDPAAVLRRF